MSSDAATARAGYRREESLRARTEIGRSTVGIGSTGTGASASAWPRPLALCIYIYI